MDEETKGTDSSVQNSDSPPKSSRHWIIQGVIDVFKLLIIDQGSSNTSGNRDEQQNIEYPPEEDSQTAVPEKESNSAGILPDDTSIK